MFFFQVRQSDISSVRCGVWLDPKIAVDRAIDRWNDSSWFKGLLGSSVRKKKKKGNRNIIIQQSYLGMRRFRPFRGSRSSGGFPRGRPVQAPIIRKLPSFSFSCLLDFLIQFSRSIFPPPISLGLFSIPFEAPLFCSPWYQSFPFNQRESRNPYTIKDKKQRTARFGPWWSLSLSIFKWQTSFTLNFRKLTPFLLLPEFTPLPFYLPSSR